SSVALRRWSMTPLGWPVAMKFSPIPGNRSLPSIEGNGGRAPIFFRNSLRGNARGVGPLDVLYDVVCAFSLSLRGLRGRRRGRFSGAGQQRHHVLTQTAFLGPAVVAAVMAAVVHVRGVVVLVQVGAVLVLGRFEAVGPRGESVPAVRTTGQSQGPRDQVGLATEDVDAAAAAVQGRPHVAAGGDGRRQHDQTVDRAGGQA